MFKKGSPLYLILFFIFIYIICITLAYFIIKNVDTESYEYNRNHIGGFYEYIYIYI